MKDIDYAAAMGKPGGGRNDVDPRFVSLFSVFNMTFPSEASLYRIYNSILAGHALPFSERIQTSVPILTRMTLDLYNAVVRDLPPTPSKFHYLFNLRDLSRIYNGLCLTTPDKFRKVTLLYSTRPARDGREPELGRDEPNQNPGFARN